MDRNTSFDGAHVLSPATWGWVCAGPSPAPGRPVGSGLLRPRLRGAPWTPGLTASSGREHRLCPRHRQKGRGKACFGCTTSVPRRAWPPELGTPCRGSNLLPASGTISGQNTPCDPHRGAHTERRRPPPMRDLESGLCAHVASPAELHGGGHACVLHPWLPGRVHRALRSLLQACEPRSGLPGRAGWAATPSAPHPPLQVPVIEDAAGLQPDWSDGAVQGDPGGGRPGQQGGAHRQQGGSELIGPPESPRKAGGSSLGPPHMPPSPCAASGHTHNPPPHLRPLLSGTFSPQAPRGAPGQGSNPTAPASPAPRPAPVLLPPPLQPRVPRFPYLSLGSPITTGVRVPPEEAGAQDPAAQCWWQEGRPQGAGTEGQSGSAQGSPGRGAPGRCRPSVRSSGGSLRAAPLLPVCTAGGDGCRPRCSRKEGACRLDSGCPRQGGPRAGEEPALGDHAGDAVEPRVPSPRAPEGATLKLSRPHRRHQDQQPTGLRVPRAGHARGHANPQRCSTAALSLGVPLDPASAGAGHPSGLRHHLPPAAVPRAMGTAPTAVRTRVPLGLGSPGRSQP